jgi:cytochrome c oxidase subunit 2
MFYIIIILCLVTYMLFNVIVTFRKNVFAHKYLIHGATLEVI